MMLRLDPPIPVACPRGKGFAHVLIDLGQEHDLQWVCFLDATGECWTARNRDVRIQTNETMGRPAAETPASPTLAQIAEGAIRHADAGGLQPGETLSAIAPLRHETDTHFVLVECHITRKRA